MIKSVLTPLIVLAALSIAIARAQDQSSTQMRAADALYFAKNYIAAVTAYKDVVAKDPYNGTAWYRLGVSLQSIGQLDEAQRDYGIALERGFAPSAVYYRLATLELQQGNRQEAVDDLTLAYKGAVFDPDQFRKDDRLAALRDYAPFVALLDKQERLFRPCRYDMRYRALDFWIGEWKVESKDGSQEYGRSRVETILDGCALEENWQSGFGGSGKSFTRYDAATNTWTQHWVDSQGSGNDFEGTTSGHSVVMVAHTTNSAGKPSLRRMTFAPLPDGRTRQYIETSDDNGRTWQVSFDGYYEREKAQP